VIKEGQTTLATVPVAGGLATYSTSSLPVGETSLSFDYSGDDNFTANSTSDSVTVGQGTVGVAVSTSPTNPAFGQAENFAITINPEIPGGGSPTGTVEVIDNGTLLETVPVDGGFASYSTSNLPVGANAMTFKYSGSGNYAAYQTSTNVTVNPAQTNIQFFAPSTAYTQSAITFTATVGSPGFAAVGQGNLVGSGPVSPQGIASFTVTDLSVGSHTMTTTFVDPGGSFASSSTGGVIMTVQQNPNTPVEINTQVIATPIYLPAPSSVPYYLGGRNTRVKFAVQAMTNATGVPIPTGYITIYANGRAYGTFALNSAGAVTVTFHGRAVYNKTITAQYLGNVQNGTTFAPSTSVAFKFDQQYFYSHSPERGKNNNSSKNDHKSSAKRDVLPAGPAHAFKPTYAAKHASTKNLNYVTWHPRITRDK
jgi:hypothetical protein